MDDLTQLSPLDLLARYRLLCENAGACRATDTPYPRELRDQLQRAEAELQTRLWLATSTEGREESQKARRPARATTTTSSRSGTGAAGSGGETPMRPMPARDGPAPDVAPLAPSRTVRRKAEPAPESNSEPEGGRLEMAPLVPSKVATVYCDGACQGNPGPGGYGALVRLPGQADRTLSGGKARTTNNEMELTGAAEGLKMAISLGAGEITVVSDSEYLVKGMSSWMKGWLRNGWKTAGGMPVKNRPLWEELHRLCQGRTVSWSWIRGHHGHLENERCDALAVAAAREARARRNKLG